MNKKVIVILLVALLLLQGVACLCGDETHTENDVDLTEPLPLDTPPTPSGIENGGGGNPG